DGLVSAACAAAGLRLYSTLALYARAPVWITVSAASVSYDFCSAVLSASAMYALTSPADGGVMSFFATTSTASVRYERTSLVSSLRNSAGEPNRSTVAIAPLIETA